MNLLESKMASLSAYRLRIRMDVHIQASLSLLAVSSFIRSLNPEVPIGQILYRVCLVSACLATHRTSHMFFCCCLFFSVSSILLSIYVFPSLIVSVALWPSVLTPCASMWRLPGKSHLKSSPASLQLWASAPWRVALLIGPGEVEGEWWRWPCQVPHSAWAEALICHAGWWFAVRGLRAVCLSTG